MAYNLPLRNNSMEFQIKINKYNAMCETIRTTFNKINSKFYKAMTNPHLHRVLKFGHRQNKKDKSAIVNFFKKCARGKNITDSLAYGTRRLYTAFRRALQ